MGRKAKYTPEQKIKACEDYLSGSKSSTEIARQLGMGKGGRTRVCNWSTRYKTYGSSVFEE
ncbi:MAG: transposase, partial [Erysipelotrichaceae bacterium]|nr:transposase [Erysipelotrichaceae bacterium]